jgi:iron transport multicopper oxidase
MRPAPSFFIAALLSAAAALPSIGPIGNLTITNAIIAPDGVPRSAILAGGTFPGPVINAQPVYRYMLAR